MQKRRVVITGMGQISPLSLHLGEFRDKLYSGAGGAVGGSAVGAGGMRPFVVDGASGTASRLLSVAAPALFSGDLEDFDSRDTAQKKAIKKAQKVMCREIQMAVAASCRALNEADIQIGQFPADRVGISFGSDYILTTVEDVLDGMRACYRKNPQAGAVLDEIFDFSRWADHGKPKMQPLWQLKYLPNMPASHIAILNNFHGPSNSITLREATIGACVGESMEIIAANRADIMLVGTTGSRLHPFKIIHALEHEELARCECRPFDHDRDGTVLGEGAGALVLEEYEHAVRRNAPIFAEVLCASYRSRFDRAGQDHRREVVAAVLRDVLRRGVVEPEQIGHINAHGLGTHISDRLEAQGINDVFGQRRPAVPVTATKGFFGNLGAGGGAVELIAGVLSLQHGTLFPTQNFRHADPDCPVAVTTKSASTEDIPAGDTFIKLAVNPQAQASAILLRKIGN